MESSLSFYLDRYLGNWWQVASIPQPYAEGCVRQSANYRSNNPELINITNFCYDGQGNVVRTIEGSGEVISTGGDPELIVNFPGTPQVDSVNYVIYSTDYNHYAIVGSPDGSTLFLLTRSKQISQSFYDQLVRKAANMGLPVNQLVQDRGAIEQRCQDWWSWFWCIIILIIIILIGAALAYWYRQRGRYSGKKHNGHHSEHGGKHARYHSESHYQKDW